MQIWGETRFVKGIEIFPITMKDIDEFYDSVQCLLFQKNRMQDIRIIKMTYLDFLFVVASQTGEQHVLDKLDKVLSLVLNGAKYGFLYDESRILLQINDVVFDGYEFDEIKKVILEMNMIKIDDDMLDPEMEQTLMEAEEFLSRKNGSPPTLEERIVTLHCLSKRPYKEIKEYTIYQFNKTLERYSIIKNFDTYAALLAENGKSDEIEHWLSHVEEKAKYADVTMTESQFKKITSDGDIFKS